MCDALACAMRPAMVNTITSIRFLAHAQLYNESVVIYVICRSNGDIYAIDRSESLMLIFLLVSAYQMVKEKVSNTTRQFYTFKMNNNIIILNEIHIQFYQNLN